MHRILIFVLTTLLMATFAPAQSGGTYQITQSATATGGTAAGGTFSMTYTAGQSIAGNTAPSAGFVMNLGFWSPEFSPTSAQASISGRVTNSFGQGVQGIVLRLTDSTGASILTRTSTFGNYRFDDIRSGETYILTINARRFTVTEPTRVITVTDPITDVNFVASELDPSH